MSYSVIRAICGPSALALSLLLAAGCEAQHGAFMPSQQSPQRRTHIVSNVVSAGKRSYVVDEIYTPSEGNLEGITAGPQGHIWFTSDAVLVGDSTIKSDIKQFLIPGYGNATSIVAGPDENLWITLYPGAIGRMSSNGHLTILSIAKKLGTPFSISNGPGDALWFLAGASSDDIVRMTLTGKMTVHRLSSSSRLQSLTYGDDGKLWFTDSGTNKIGSMDARGAVKEFAVPTPNAGLSGICHGPDGNLWFLEQSANKVGRITTSGSFHEYDIPTYPSGAAAIVAGPDGALWFTEEQAGQIGRVTTSGSFEELKLSADYARPLGISVGSDKNVWFTESQSSGIMGRVDLHEVPGSDPIYSEITLSLGKSHLQLGVPRKVPLSISVEDLHHHVISGRYPNPIHLTTTDPQNAALSASTVQKSASALNVLFSGHYTDAAIGANARGGGAVSPSAVIPSTPRERKLPDYGYGLTAGPNNTVWICLAGGSLARYSANGSLKSFSVTTSFTEEGCSMLEGPDGNVWFTDYSNDRIGKITPAGQVTFFSLGSDTAPYSMALGSDGALWFTEAFANKIGRLTIDGQLTSFNPGSSSPLVDIVAGPDDNLWYNDEAGNIYKLTTSGKSARVRNIYEIGGLWSAYGHLWFWTANGFDLEEMTTSGSIVRTYCLILKLHTVFDRERSTTQHLVCRSRKRLRRSHDALRKILRRADL